MEESKESKICLVCSAPNTAVHLGVEVCRACSSFFRRVTRSGRRYPCRKIDRNCDITKKGLVSCRGCRYDKCVTVGLALDGPLRRNKKVDEQNPNDQPNKSAECSILDRIGREYEISIANREARELAILRKTPEATRLPHPTKELYTGTADLVMRMNPLTFEETWRSFRKTFPSLRNLQMRDQVAMYRSYLPNFTIVDSLIRSWRAFGTYDEYSMTMTCICVDLRTPDEWFGPNEGGANRDALLKSMALCISDQMALIVPSLTKAQLTEQEMHALFAQVLCDSGTKLEVSSDAYSLLESIRQETLSDLQRYYREEMGLIEFSTRLGNLMTICLAVKECSRLFHSVFRMQVALFDVWSMQAQMMELLL